MKQEMYLISTFLHKLEVPSQRALIVAPLVIYLLHPGNSGGNWNLLGTSLNLPLIHGCLVNHLTAFKCRWFLLFLLHLLNPLILNSAGVGRTGVFITLSIVLERMRYEGVVDIFQTVKMLRTQRPATVQTEVSLLPLHSRLLRGFSFLVCPDILSLCPHPPPPGPVPVLLQGQSGVLGKLRSLCNINPTAVSSRHIPPSALSWTNALGCDVPEDFCCHTRREAGLSQKQHLYLSHTNQLDEGRLLPPSAQTHPTVSPTKQLKPLPRSEYVIRSWFWNRFRASREHPDCFTLFGCGTLTSSTTSVASPI